MLCLTILWLPSTDIIQEEFKTLETPLEASFIRAGEPLFLKNIPRDLHLNGKRLSQPFDRSISIGSVGLYSGKTAIFHRLVQSYKHRLYELFHFDKLTLYSKTLPITYPKKRRAATLRLPANVIKKINSPSDLRKQKERRLVQEILEQASKTKPAECWQLPVKSKTTSRFSAPRTLPSGRTYYHSGLDLRAYTGTPISTGAPGTIVFAGLLTVPGNTVIIDHGGEIFSKYMHLSKIKVNPGDTVLRGQTIGLAGATGRVEAAHLHWEVNWKSRHLSPALFVHQWNQRFCPKYASKF